MNLQLASRKAARLTTAHWLFVSLCATLVLVSAALVAMNSPYLGWDFTDPETAVFGAAFHVFEWLFVRLAPLALVATIFGIFLTRKKA